MSTTISPPVVLVTGVSGYIGSWVAFCALKQGFRVRGTVRSLANEKKVSHLKNICPDAAYPLELFEADLTSSTGWNEAVNGCDFILHVASPFPIVSPKDKQDLIRPAVDGTLHVLQAAADCVKPPKRVVITSSVASIAYGYTPEEKNTFTDEDWTNLNNPKSLVAAYAESKTLAEQAAWKFMETLAPEKKFELATVNPTLVQGPLLSNSDCSSADINKQILLGLYPAIPNLQFDVVSVIDVAKAHILAMTHPDAAGKRFMVTSGSITLPEISKVLNTEFRSQGYRPTTAAAPKWLIGMLALFGDKQSKSIYPMIGGQQKILNPNNARTILGMSLKSDAAELIKQTVYSAIANGQIADKSPGQTISKEYKMPELDFSDLPLASSVIV